MRKITYLIFIVTLFISSCHVDNSEEVEPQTTDLQITVVNELGQRINAANVTLYQLKTDYINNINAVDFGTTDSKGVVTFKNLRTINYYFYIEKEPATNEFTEQKTIAPLTSNMLNTVTVLIE